MASPNESSILTTNSGISTPSTKRKSPKKSGTPAREAAVPAKKQAAKSTGPTEILFTQEPNPHREPTPPFIWIDFPTQNEILRAPSYVIRLGVGGADLVEISLDKGQWLPCRLTSGYWWYDWNTIAPGKHTLVARMRASDGRWFKTPPRQCTFRAE